MKIQAQNFMRPILPLLHNVKLYEVGPLDVADPLSLWG